MSTFIPLRRAASRLGVSFPWLRSEADAGRIPRLLVGQRVVVNVDAVRDTLMQRAAAEVTSEVQRGR